MRERDRVRIFILLQQRIERYENLYTVRMGILNHLRQILQTVTRGLSGTVSRCTDINRICTRLDCRERYLLVARRREEAKRYSTMPAVTDTFIECFVPYCGISIH